jgi:hypothetical protein
LIYDDRFDIIAFFGSSPAGTWLLSGYRSGEWIIVRMGNERIVNRDVVPHSNAFGCYDIRWEFEVKFSHHGG